MNWRKLDRCFEGLFVAVCVGILFEIALQIVHHPGIAALIVLLAIIGAGLADLAVGIARS